MRSMNLVEILLVDVRAGHVDRGAQVLVELVGRPLLARVPDDPQVLESLAVLEREQRGKQQAGREIAGRAEHDECRLRCSRSASATATPAMPTASRRTCSRAACDATGRRTAAGRRRAR